MAQHFTSETHPLQWYHVGKQPICSVGCMLWWWLPPGLTAGWVGRTAGTKTHLRVLLLWAWPSHKTWHAEQICYNSLWLSNHVQQIMFTVCNILQESCWIVVWCDQFEVHTNGGLSSIMIWLVFMRILLCSIPQIPFTWAMVTLHLQLKLSLTASSLFNLSVVWALHESLSTPRKLLKIASSSSQIELYCN